MIRSSYKRGVVKGARLWWLDTGWACGGVFVRKGRIVGGAPIFRKFGGQRIRDLPGRYKVQRV